MRGLVILLPLILMGMTCGPRKPASPGAFIEEVSCVHSYNQGKKDKAREHCEACLEYSEGQGRCLNMLGILEFEEGRLATAAEYFKQAIKAEPKLPTAHSNLGSVYFKLGNYAEAFKFFKKAVELDPGYQDARDNLELTKTKLNEQKSDG